MSPEQLLDHWLQNSTHVWKRTGGVYHNAGTPGGFDFEGRAHYIWPAVTIEVWDVTLREDLIRLLSKLKGTCISIMEEKMEEKVYLKTTLGYSP